MSVEVNVVGNSCGAQQGGLSCAYCYEHGLRGRKPDKVDHEAIQRAVLATGCKSFSLHGGEPLLASIEDLETLFKFGLKNFKQNGVQTSGRPIREEHYRLFRKYRVHVGFSIDGLGELNDARVAGTKDDTRWATARSCTALRRCLEEGIRCSLIVTLNRHNATATRLPSLTSWLTDLAESGLETARIHLLEVDSPAGAKLALTDDENVAALFALRDLERRTSLRFDFFGDIERKLLDPAGAKATCTWNGCDPWTTPAVVGIEPDGSRQMCQRVHKDRTWIPMDGPRDRMRQRVLWSTPQENGGCSGCRFFLVCGGHCPGTAEGGDWRRRTAHCGVLLRVMQAVEAELIARGEKPATLNRDLSARVEAALAAPSVTSGHGDKHGDRHGDHWDSSGRSR